MNMVSQNKMIGNFVLYGLVNVFSGFNKTIIVAEFVLCILLSFATVWRYVLAKNQIHRLDNGVNGYWKSVLWALSLIFIFAIPIPLLLHQPHNFYLGSFTPNVWHNSTTIFLFPFAILLFHLSCKQLYEFNVKNNFWIVLLVSLNIFIKPSYFFVWVYVYPLFLLYSYRFNKTFWKSMIPVAIGVALLAIEYIIIYRTQSVYKENSSVEISPFLVYKGFYNHLEELPLVLFFSLLFPNLYVLFNFKTSIKDKKLLFALCSIVVAIIIFLLLSETGGRQSHGNFYWQIIICSWLYFYVALTKMIQNKSTVYNKYKNNTLYIVYFLHVLAGIIYLIRFLFFNTYF
ncbi:MAG: hypothetical protein LBV69_09110 [Bacteroidales bacterium]|nr:hypothetical protein [Bacteroidales bacterium]